MGYRVITGNHLQTGLAVTLLCLGPDNQMVVLFVFTKSNFNSMGEFIGSVIGIGVVIVFIFRLFAKRDRIIKEAEKKHDVTFRSGQFFPKNSSKTDDRTS